MQNSAFSPAPIAPTQLTVNKSSILDGRTTSPRADTRADERGFEKVLREERPERNRPEPRETGRREPETRELGSREDVPKETRSSEKTERSEGSTSERQVSDSTSTNSSPEDVEANGASEAQAVNQDAAEQETTNSEGTDAGKQAEIDAALAALALLNGEVAEGVAQVDTSAEGEAATDTIDSPTANKQLVNGEGEQSSELLKALQQQGSAQAAGTHQNEKSALGEVASKQTASGNGLGDIAGKLAQSATPVNALNGQATASQPNVLQQQAALAEAQTIADELAATAEIEIAATDGEGFTKASDSQKASLAGDFAKILKGDGAINVPENLNNLAQAAQGKEAPGLTIQQNANGLQNVRAQALPTNLGYNQQGIAPETNQQMQLAISKFVQGGKEQFKVQLHPAELGRIDVRLERSEDGTMQAKVVVEKGETLELLQRDIRTLERTLQQSGIKLGDGGIDLNLEDRGSESGDNSQEMAGEADEQTGQSASSHEEEQIVVDPALLENSELSAMSDAEAQLLGLGNFGGASALAYAEMRTTQLDISV